MNTDWLDEVQWTSEGLAPAIAQDRNSGAVLTLAWMNRESLQLSFVDGYATYWSRSRRKLWRKGESSGHWQKIDQIWLDCDADALLLRVEQQGVACHTGRPSCFYRRLSGSGWQQIDPESEEGAASESRREGNDILRRLTQVLRQRLEAEPSSSYVASLYHSGLDSILKKIGEEAAETIIAAKNGSRAELIHETADLWFHSMVLLVQQGLSPEEVLIELESRFGRPPEAGKTRQSAAKAAPQAPQR